MTHGVLLLALAASFSCFTNAFVLHQSSKWSRVSIQQFDAPNPVQTFIDGVGDQLKGLMPPTKAAAGSEFDTDIEAAKNILLRAVESKAEDGDAVVDALIDLEKLQRAKAKVDPKVAVETLEGLDGAWRLVFTTGTIDTQKKNKGDNQLLPSQGRAVL